MNPDCQLCAHEVEEALLAKAECLDIMHNRAVCMCVCLCVCVCVFAPIMRFILVAQCALFTHSCWRGWGGGGVCTPL